MSPVSTVFFYMGAPLSGKDWVKVIILLAVVILYSYFGKGGTSAVASFLSNRDFVSQILFPFSGLSWSQCVKVQNLYLHFCKTVSLQQFFRAVKWTLAPVV